MNQTTAPLELPLSEFAEFINYKKSYVSELKGLGRLVMTADGKNVRVAESIARIEETRHTPVPVPPQLSVPDFSAHIGCKRTYAYQLKKEGRLVMAPDGKNVLVADSIARIAATRDPAHQAVAVRHAATRGADVDTGHATDLDTQDPATDPPDQPTGNGYNFQDSKAKREHYAAEREHTTFLKEAGELSERSAVLASYSMAGTTLRNKLESWQATLPPQLAGRDEAAIRIILADLVERILLDLVDAFNRLSAEAT